MENINTNKVLKGAFKWMVLGLFVSGLSSIAILVLGVNFIDVVFSPFVFFALILAELGLVIYLTKKLSVMTSGQAKFYFSLYSILSGLTLSVIFLTYQTLSIISIFFAAAIMFIALALFGANTKKDLSKFSTIAYYTLVGLVIATLINMFIGSPILDYVLAWVGVLLFSFLVTRDVQKIKALSENVQTEEGIKKASILGALKLYLDFVNLFLSLLRIFGKRK